MVWIEDLRENGYCVIENFLTIVQVEELKLEIKKIVENAEECGDKSVFTTNNEKHVKDKYFLDSTDKIRYFYEDGAFNKDGSLTVPKERALNKVGHALHVLNPVFHRITFSKKVVDLFEQLKFLRPVIPQSMYIFKQPSIGGAVNSHIDASFLLCEPPSCLTGVWIALDDATTENGCLWFAPGSHRNNLVTKKFVRTNGSHDEFLKFEGSSEPPSEDSFIPAPVSKGSCVLINGLVWHKSEINKSENPRHAYSFHVVDEASSTWDQRAWLQPSEDYRFPCLFDRKSLKSEFTKDF